MKQPPLRHPNNTSLTISLTKELKANIEAAAAEDRRKVSPWIVIQLEKILDDLEKSKPLDQLDYKRPTHPPLASVADSTSSPSTPAVTVPAVKYPRGRHHKS